METLLRRGKKLIPKKLFRILQPPYHYLLAFAGALLYRFPSREITVIGVTGTKGKSTVAELVSALLEAAGHSVALAGTVRFKVGGKSQPNLHKMTMPGRFFIQKFLREAVRAGCEFAVLEMTSEGAKQFRHAFIALDALIFTNLAPEHIEAHGSFEKYRDAKLSIARALDRSSKKRKVLVVNGDDKEAGRFVAAAPRAEAIRYTLAAAAPVAAAAGGSTFAFRGATVAAKLPGLFNVSNMLAAAAAAEAFGAPPPAIARALGDFSGVPGRMQAIEKGQDFRVIVDYAHTPDSLEALYRTFRNDRAKLVCVLGNTGGGRDAWKRRIMGGIADRYCDEIFLTDEDPYDEDPAAIVREMRGGMTAHSPRIVMDRREAIREALASARALRSAAPDDVSVLISGKGTDPYIMRKNGGREPWNDARVAEEEIEKLLSSRNAR